MDTIIIEGLEIWPEDLGEMTWYDAMDKVASLGPAWRLPIGIEFKEILYPNREKLPGNLDGYYWSSIKFVGNDDYAWIFGKGSSNFVFKFTTNSVCAVRDLTSDIAIEYLLKDF